MAGGLTQRRLAGDEICALWKQSGWLRNRCSGLPGVKNANVRSILIERLLCAGALGRLGSFPVTATRCLSAARSGHMIERYTLRIAVIEKTGRAVQVYGVRPGLSRRNQ